MKAINIIKEDVIKTKHSIEQYLDMTMPYLSDLITENKAIETSSNEWKIQINMHINFVSSNDTG